MATLKVSLDSKGNPVTPAGWFDMGKWAVSPQGQYFSDDDLNADGTVTLHDPQANWQNSDTGRTILAAVNAAPAPPITVAPGPAAPAAQGNFVPGRTLAQAIAAGDVWGFTVDPATKQ